MKHSQEPWTIEVLETQTNIEGKYQTIAYDVSNNDAPILTAAPEMLRLLKNIVSSAPLKGLPLALEKDIQDACIIITRLNK